MNFKTFLQKIHITLFHFLFHKKSAFIKYKLSRIINLKIMLKTIV